MALTVQPSIHLTGTPSWLTKTKSLWAEARPPVQLVFVLRAIAAAGYGRLFTFAGLMLPAGWLLLSVSVYVFNGLSDLQGDRVNGSSRPLAAGQLTVRDARLAVVASCVGGLSLCEAVSTEVLLLALTFVLLGWAYSAGPALKKTPLGASAAIGGGAGLTYAAGLSLRPTVSLTDFLIPVLLATWVSVACNSKDFSDVDGDAVAGRRTLPVRLGLQTASVLVAAVTTLLGFSLATCLALADPRLLPVGLALAAGSLSFGVVVLRNSRSTVPQTRRRGYRVYMLTQYAVNVVLMVGS